MFNPERKLLEETPEQAEYTVIVAVFTGFMEMIMENILLIRGWVGV